MSPGSTRCIADDQKARLRACLNSSFLNSNTFPLPGSSTTKAGPGGGTWGPAARLPQREGGDKRQEGGGGRRAEQGQQGSAAGLALCLFPACHRTASLGRIAAAESPGPHGNRACHPAPAGQEKPVLTRDEPMRPAGFPKSKDLHNKCFPTSVCHTPTNFANLPLAANAGVLYKLQGTNTAGRGCGPEAGEGADTCRVFLAHLLLFYFISGKIYWNSVKMCRVLHSLWFCQALW